MFWISIFLNGMLSEIYINLKILTYDADLRKYNF